MEQCLPWLNYLREANTVKLLSGDFSKHDTTAEIRKESMDRFDFAKMRYISKTFKKL